MAEVNALENGLDDIFGKKAPQMPDGGKKFFVQWLPVITLAGAILSIIAAWLLWSAVHVTNGYVNLANELSKAYGTGETVSTSYLTFWVWIALAFIIAEAVLYFMAYNPLKAKAKRGWDLLFYASLVSVVYSVVTLFIHGRGVGSMIGGLIGTAIGWWILFQIRPAYLAKASAPHMEAKKSENKPEK